ncbi:MAG: glycosyltransferase [Actinomycetota bacterium]|nr:glycosyltransferase [Actinomycetota bacterium]
MILTPPTGRALAPGSVMIAVAGRRTPILPQVHPVAPSDVRIVLGPDPALTDGMLIQRSALVQFLLGLPDGVQTSIGAPAGSGPRPFTTDVTSSIAQLARASRRQPAQSSARRLLAALSALPPAGPARRAVILVTSTADHTDAPALNYLRRRLAAGAVALYVVDLSTTERGNALDTLAGPSGGFAARLAAGGAGGTFTRALRQVTVELSRQVEIEFPYPAGDPGRVTVSAPATGTAPAVVALPARGTSIGPPPVSLRTPAPPPAGRRWDLLLIGFAGLLVLLSLSYGTAMYLASSREPWRPLMPSRTAMRLAHWLRQTRPPRGADSEGSGLSFVFLLPCLNEATVIRASVQRLLEMPVHEFVVMVIDDGSDDATAAEVSAVDDERVWLLRRSLPEARQGKGEALNAAVAHLVAGAGLAGMDPSRVIVAVIDADGRLEPGAVTEVTPYFNDPSVGGVQIGVRINNRHVNRLARMQDMEFVIYTEIFQRGRTHLGSVGLGGNGQFMRLSALLSLGAAPWSRSLTEDLDLGIRLVSSGWRNEYCPTAAVHQQGVTELPRLVRQRSRWFQGHLQSWRLLPVVLRGAPRRARADLIYHLTSPVLLLITTLLSLAFLLSLFGMLASAVSLHNPFSWWILPMYALSFGPAIMYARVYWRREREHGLSLWRAIGLAHLYVLYGMMWYFAGWWAVGRTVRGRTSWAKTDRTAEEPAAEEPAALVPAEAAFAESAAS